MQLVSYIVQFHSFLKYGRRLLGLYNTNPKADRFSRGVATPWEGGTKVYINGPGHMTKMAAMPIYGKKLKKSSSP